MLVRHDEIDFSHALAGPVIKLFPMSPGQGYGSQVFNESSLVFGKQLVAFDQYAGRYVGHRRMQAGVQQVDLKYVGLGIRLNRQLGSGNFYRFVDQSRIQQPLNGVFILTPPGAFANCRVRNRGLTPFIRLFPLHGVGSLCYLL